MQGDITNVELTHEASAEPIVRPESVTLANGGGPNKNNSLYNENTLDGKQVYVKIDTAEDFEGNSAKVALRFIRKLSGEEVASYWHIISCVVKPNDGIALLNDEEMTYPDKALANQIAYHGLYRLYFDANGTNREIAVYLPEGTRRNEFFVTLALPDGVNAYTYLKDSGWMDIADSNNIALRVLIPENGVWGDYSSKEKAYISAARSAGSIDYGPYYYTSYGYDYLFGAGEGGTVLERWACENPKNVISQVFVDTDMSKDTLVPVTENWWEWIDLTVGNNHSLQSPYWGACMAEVPVPTWMVGSKSDSVDYWKMINDCVDTGSDLGSGVTMYKQSDDSNAIATSYNDVYTQVRVSDSGDYADASFVKESFDFLHLYSRSGDTIYNNALGWKLDENEAKADGRLFEYFDYKQVVDNSGNSKATTATTTWNRNYMVYVPESCKDYASKKYPVMYYFSGGSSPSHTYMEQTRAYELAEKYQFIAVVPSAVNAWNVLDGSWNPITEDSETGSISDDIGFVDQLMDTIEADFNTDPGRVYVGGLSMGSIFSNYVGMQLGDRITAVATASGPIFGSDKEGIQYDASSQGLPTGVGTGLDWAKDATTNLLPTMYIHGEKDNWPLYIGEWSWDEGLDNVWYPGQMWNNSIYWMWWRKNDVYYPYTSQKYWLTRNGLALEDRELTEKGLLSEGQNIKDEDKVSYNDGSVSNEYNRRYTTWQWKNSQGVPLFAWSACAGRAHSTAISDYEKLWVDWCAHYKKDGDTLYYSASAFASDDAIAVTKDDLKVEAAMPELPESVEIAETADDALEAAEDLTFTVTKEANLKNADDFSVQVWYEGDVLADDEDQDNEDRTRYILTQQAEGQDSLTVTVKKEDLNKEGTLKVRIKGWSDFYAEAEAEGSITVKKSETAVSEGNAVISVTLNGKEVSSSTKVNVNDKMVVSIRPAADESRKIQALRLFTGESWLEGGKEITPETNAGLFDANGNFKTEITFSKAGKYLVYGEVTFDAQTSKEDVQAAGAAQEMTEPVETSEETEEAEFSETEIEDEETADELEESEESEEAEAPEEPEEDVAAVYMTVDENDEISENVEDFEEESLAVYEDVAVRMEVSPEEADVKEIEVFAEAEAEDEYVAGVSASAVEKDEADNRNWVKTAEVEINVTAEEAAKPDQDEKTVVKKGKVYTISNMKYKVTNANMKGKGTVTLIGTTKKSTKLTKLTVKASVKISGAAFKVTAIGKNAFKKYTKLKTVSIGKNVKTIGSGAFQGDTALTKVTIGTGVTKIGKNAFSGDKKLKTMVIKSKKLASVGKNAFKGIYAKAKIKVPKAKLAKYKALLKAKTGFKKTMKITK